jgi:hypothetical protein
MKSKLSRQLAIGTALILAAATSAHAADYKVQLTGAEEIPAVTTSASGGGTFSIAADKTITGSVTTRDLKATAAHIHAAPPGKSGPPVVSLVSTAENTWSVPAGTKLTDEQFANFQAGQFYVNVHSAEHKPGEIRGALRP